MSVLNQGAGGSALTPPFLGEPFDDAMTFAGLRKAESVGRSARSKEWLADMEVKTGIKLAPAKQGSKRKDDVD